MNAPITLTLGVYRRLDNRMEGQPDDSPRALELHNRRREALHDVFDPDAPLSVTDWGDTDDTKAHEFVELALGAAVGAAFNYAVVPGMKFLGKKLAEAAVDTATAEAVNWIVARLRLKQEEKRILDFQITLPDGTTIAVDPPDRAGTLTVTLADGRPETVTYTSAPGDAG